MKNWKENHTALNLGWVALLAGACLPLGVWGEPEDEGAEKRRVIRIERHEGDAPEVKLLKPGRRVERVVEQKWVSDKSSTWLGVHIDKVSKPLAAQLGLKSGVGLVVQHVVPGSPAEAAGLKQYDVLTELDDQRLINPDQLQVLVSSFEAGDEVEIGYIREGKSRKVDATLAKRKGGVRRVRLRGDAGDVNEVEIEGRIFTGKPLSGFSFEDEAIDDLVWEGKVRDDLGALHTQRVEIGNAITVLKDDSGTYRLTNKNGKRHLKFEDGDGKVIFDGDFTGEAKGVPLQIIKKLEGIKAPEEVGVHRLRRLFKGIDDESVDVRIDGEAIFIEEDEDESGRDL